MARDMMGNDIQKGDVVLLNGMKGTVLEIKDDGLVGASPIIHGKTQGIVLPGTLNISILIEFDQSKLVGVYVLKVPPKENGKNQA